MKSYSKYFCLIFNPLPSRQCQGDASTFLLLPQGDRRGCGAPDPHPAVPGPLLEQAPISLTCTTAPAPPPGAGLNGVTDDHSIKLDGEQG